MNDLEKCFGLKKEDIENLKQLRKDLKDFHGEKYFNKYIDKQLPAKELEKSYLEDENSI